MLCPLSRVGQLSIEMFNFRNPRHAGQAQMVTQNDKSDVAETHKLKEVQVHPYSYINPERRF